MIKRIFRVLILIVVLSGVLGLAHTSSQVALAAETPGQADPSVSSQPAASISPGNDNHHDDCHDPRNRRRPKCQRDKIWEKLKKFCRKHPRLCRSILPPPPWVHIPVTGHYSVGGLCTLSVTNPQVQLAASVVAPLPYGLPETHPSAGQGCLLEYERASTGANRLLAGQGSTTICFASPPDKQATVYYYNDSSQPEWVPLATTADPGKACAPANESGVYMATSARP